LERQIVMTHRWSIGRAGVALIAAYALALQALLASFGAGVTVIRDELAAIAGTICTANADGSAPIMPAEHDRADCCILCAAPGAGSTGHIDVFAGLPDYGLWVRLAAIGGVQLHGTIAWLPGGARAPPWRV
jgi:hypothetical protein